MSESTIFDRVQTGVPLRNYTTLRAGGNADEFVVAYTVDELAELAIDSQRKGTQLTVLGGGSNILPSDKGIRGRVVIHVSRRIAQTDTKLVVDSGCWYQEVCLFAAQKGLAGMEYAVGIPGSIGGASVSNAGAYRRNLDAYVTRGEVVFEGERKWVDASFFEFEYRNSVLRRPDFPPCVILRLELQLSYGDPKEIYDLSRENQRQRIGKQPAPASAGSFFKNVKDHALAQTIEGLTPGMRESGVIPSGFLLEAVGFKGKRLGGAMFSSRHANFLLNAAGATATELRSLSYHAKNAVRDRFGVELEEEVLFLGDWAGFEPLSLN